MKPSKKKRKQKCKRGWSKVEIIMILALIVDIIKTIIDLFN